MYPTTVLLRLAAAALPCILASFAAGHFMQRSFFAAAPTGAAIAAGVFAMLFLALAATGMLLWIALARALLNRQD